MVIRNDRIVFRLSDQVLPAVESDPNMISLISFNAKMPGKRNAGKPHVAFDEAGAGNGMMVEANWARGWKQRIQTSLKPKTSPRQFSTLPERGWGCNAPVYSTLICPVR